MTQMDLKQWGKKEENLMEICLLRSPRGSTHIWCVHLLLFVVSLVETGHKEVTRFMHIMIYALRLFLLQFLDFYAVFYAQIENAHCNWFIKA